MADRAHLVDWVEKALRELGGEARVVEVAKAIWARHEAELRASGDLFFTWQYDMRWAALKLRKQGRLVDAGTVQRGFWALTPSAL